MNSKMSRAVALGLAILMVGAIAGPAVADYTAPPSIDTSTTDDTSTTSEVQDGDTLGDNSSFAANSSKTKTVQWIAPSNDTKVEIHKNGSDHIAYENGSAEVVVWNSTDADGHYNATFSHDQLADIEHAIDSNTTLDVDMINNTTADSTDVGTATVYVEWNNETTTQVVSASDVGDIAEVKSENGTFGFAPLGGEDESRITTDTRQINGSGTDVVLVASADNVSEDFQRATADASEGAKLSSLQALNPFSVERTVVLVRSADTDSWQAVPVYSDSAPDSVDSDTTYAVQKDVGGETAIVTNLGSEYDDADEVEVKAVGSAGFTTYATKYLSAGIPNLLG